MTKQHPITPLPELVQQWASAQNYTIAPAWILNEIAQKAAQWGADQELEACCEWTSEFVEIRPNGDRPEHQLRAARRPKPPSLKQQAQAALLRLASESNDLVAQGAADMETIRRALEQLDD